jgi:hypothetical protein
MKPILLTILTTIALCSSSLATADEKTIQAADAAQHVGETVVVSGTVADVHQFRGGSVVLNFGGKYPNEVFEVYIPRNLVDTTGDMHEYVGKEMVVEGTITLYKDKPEIKLEDAGQLRR